MDDVSLENGKSTFDLAIRPEVIGIIDALLETLKISPAELINQCMFYYHPQLFLSMAIDEQDLYCFLDEQEQLRLKQVAEFFHIPEEKVFHHLFKLEDREKN